MSPRGTDLSFRWDLPDRRPTDGSYRDPLHVTLEIDHSRPLTRGEVAAVAEVVELLRMLVEGITFADLPAEVPSITEVGS